MGRIHKNQAASGLEIKCRFGSELSELGGLAQARKLAKLMI